MSKNRGNNFPHISAEEGKKQTLKSKIVKLGFKKEEFPILETKKVLMKN